MSIQNVHDNAAYRTPEGVGQPQTPKAQAELVREKPVANAPPGERQEQHDRYDRDDPVGEPVEGLYSLERDEDGNTWVEYVEPRARGDDVSKEGATSAQGTDDSQEASKGTSSTPSKTNSMDREVQRLKTRMQRLQREVRMETDAGMQAKLQGKIQQLSVEIAWKESESYRQLRAVAS